MTTVITTLIWITLLIIIPSLVLTQSMSADEAPVNVTECAAGNFLDYNECRPCLVGAYKNTTGPEACTPCPVDHQGHQSTTRNRGADSSIYCFFRPYIKSFTPDYGPVAGGTIVTIDIGHLESREPVLGKVATAVCPRNTIYRTNLSVVVQTRPVQGVRQGLVILQLTDNRDEYILVSNNSFKYMHNPTIHSVDRLKTILSGGIPLVVNGSHLTSVSKPRMVITRLYEGNTTQFITPCTVLSEDKMTCITPDLKEGLNMTHVLSLLRLKNSHLNNTTATDEDTTLPSQPRAEPARPKRYAIQYDTQIMDSYNSEYEINDRYKRDTDTYRYDTNPEPINSGENLTFFLGFDLDGVDDYSNFSMLPVYMDPVLYRFPEPKSLKTYRPNEEVINIKGERLNYGIVESDIDVSIGVGRCKLSLLATNVLICRPPTAQPDPGLEGSGPHNLPMVIVYIGLNLEFVIGYLEYLPHTRTSSNMFLLYMTITSFVLLLLLVTAFVCTLCICNKRKLKPLKREESVSTEQTDLEMQSDTSYSSRSSSERSSSVENGSASEVPYSISSGSDYLQYAELDFEALSRDPVLRLLSNSMREQVKSCCLDSKRLTLGSCVGQGNFGRVYKGQLTDDNLQSPTTVAVKTLQEIHVSPGDLSSFLEEALIMKDIEHTNILSLYGVVIMKLKPHVVIEYMDFGDLRRFVANKTMSMTKGELLGYGLQVAEGMQYLSSQGFVHRDLAARNCMINADLVVKIADFGLSHDLNEKDYYMVSDVGRPLPVKWMACESLNSGKFSIKSDVWSFGVLLWELLSRGVTPYPDVDNYDLKDYINQGRRLDILPAVPNQLWSLMESCWFEEPDSRPTFTELVQNIKTILKDNEDIHKRDYLEVL